MTIQADEPLLDRLYRIAKAQPCTCVYRRTPDGFPVYQHNQRILEQRCERCLAVEEYEAMQATQEAS